jgi:AAA ATPase domain
MTDRPLQDERARITRVEITNFKSIAKCSVELGDLTFLVGLNGSGKSNFLEAVALLADCLVRTPQSALHDLGGATTIRRPPGGRTSRYSFDVRLDFQLSDGVNGHYVVSLAPETQSWLLKPAAFQTANGFLSIVER